MAARQPADEDHGRRRDAAVGLVAALCGGAALVALGGVPGSVVSVPLAGLVAGAVARDGTAGQAGLLVAFLTLTTAWGVSIVRGQIESCKPDCAGLSSLGITVAFAVVIAVVVEICAMLGFVVGRIVRRIRGTDHPA